MARNLKCQRCGIADTPKSEMEFEVVGIKKPVNKYYHKDCFVEHLKDKEFRKKEAEELDKLVEVIKEIYGVKSIPNNAYPFLQDLRNGTKFFGKNDYKYKEGYPYDLIAETFDYCSETIEESLRRISFNGFMNSLRYGLAIVCDKMKVVEQRRERQERQEEVIQAQIDNLSGDEYEFETNYKKPKQQHTDITDFLDD